MVSSLARSWPSARGADGVDVADDVGDGHVRRGQLLDVALLGGEPGDRRLVPALGHEVAAAAAERTEGVVVDLAPGHHGQGGIEQGGEAAQEPALGLAAQAEQDHVVAREDRVRDLGHDGLVVAEDAREERSPPPRSLRMRLRRISSLTPPGRRRPTA